MNMKASSPGGPKRIQISNLFKSSVKEVFVLFVHKIDIFSTELVTIYLDDSTTHRSGIMTNLVHSYDNI